jgi:hypothetical protein
MYNEKTRLLVKMQTVSISPTVCIISDNLGDCPPSDNLGLQ